MNNKSIFMLGWGEENFKELPNELLKEGLCIRYWTSSNSSLLKEEVSTSYPRAIFQKGSDIFNGNMINEPSSDNIPPCNPDLLKKLSECEVEVLGMMDRMDYFCTSTGKRKRIFHQMVSYWDYILNENNIDLVVFPVIPHQIYDFVVYCLAKVRNIDTMYFQYTAISSRMLIVEDILYGNRNLKLHHSNNEEMIESASHDVRKVFFDAREKDKDNVPLVIQLNRSDKISINKLALVIKERRVIKSINGLIKRFVLFPEVISFKYLSFFKYNTKRIAWYFHQIKLRFEYNSLVDKISFSEKYIYVAMHFQPEASTIPMGGVYSDQLLMIETLSHSLPDGWLLYVKEVENQLHSKAGKSYQGRWLGYYKSISKINNVKIISTNISTFDLLKSCQAIATVSGTVGWEAVLRDKPALIFGYPWYMHSPWICRVSSVDSCRKFINKIRSGDFNAHKKETVNYLIALDKYSVSCQTNPRIIKTLPLSNQENCQSIAREISEYINLRLK